MNPIIKNTVGVSIILLILISQTSCLKEHTGDCPAAYQVRLVVEDKNYDNATSIPDLALRDEQQAFREYVKNISYHLVSATTGEIVNNQPNSVIQDDEKTHLLDFSTVAPGRYILNLFGNTNSSSLRAEDILTYSLHPSGEESNDIYIAHDTLDINPGAQESSIPLLRTKGALFIQIENLPDSVAKVEEYIQNIYESIDETFYYSKEITVAKAFTDNLHPQASLFTIVAPTVNGKQSVLRLALYTQGAPTPYMFIPDVPLTIKRNEITAFKFNFKLEGGIEVWISVNGIWTKLHDLDIL